MRMWLNSKKINKGDVFLVNEKNKCYVNDAIKNGASLIVTETEDVFEIETKNVKSIKAYMKDHYEADLKDMVLIGITGTNGKTTTCYLIYQMLNYIGIKTAYIGTIGFYMNDDVTLLDNTTPDIDVLYNLIVQAKENGVKVVVMEVSSHALKQDRVYGLSFDCVAVTNVTKDHMDYHKTIEDYINSKRKIIKKLKGPMICILNKKDKYYKRFKSKKNHNYIIGKDVKIKKINMNLKGTVLTFKDRKKYKVRLSLVGKFNMLNYLMVYKIVKELGFNIEKIIKNSSLFTEPPGRMQKIVYKDNVIFIDYAHTPDAVLNVLKTVKKVKNKGIITIIGCGGNRDKEKRPIMAKIACKNSSYVIFTNDNPRQEDEKKIMTDVLKGARGKYEVIYDRRDAITRGVNLLDGKKILMILGKGHEDYQIIGKEKLHFSDFEEVNNIISKK